MPVHGEYHGEKASVGRALWRVVGFASHTVIRQASLMRRHLSGDLQDLGGQALRYLQKLGSRQGSGPSSGAALSMVDLYVDCCGHGPWAHRHEESGGRHGLRLRTWLTVCHCVPCRSLFSSVHFLLLVFVELPLFLSMLSAVLWVNRPQRSSGERRGQPDCENQ